MNDPVFWQLGWIVLQQTLVATAVVLAVYYGSRWLLGHLKIRRPRQRSLALQLQGPHRSIPDSSHEPTTESSL
jgi:hypothetical protein